MFGEKNCLLQCLISRLLTKKIFLAAQQVYYIFSLVR